MDINQILYAVLSIGGIGAILGFILAIAAKIFYVPVDPKVEMIEESLPNANCGACGFPGCSGYAAAVASGKAELTLCSPGGQSVVEKIANIMGVTAGTTTPKVAYCACQGTPENANNRFEYQGPKSCSLAVFASGGHKSCTYGCLGFGDCVDACDFGAIYIDPKTQLPVVDDEKCTGCMACIKACPKDVMKMMPKDSKIYIACNSLDKGKDATSVCKVSCIACKICTTPKVVPAKGITMNGNIPKMDYDKQVDFTPAKYKCPKGCFIDKRDKNKTKEDMLQEKSIFLKKEKEKMEAEKKARLEAKKAKEEAKKAEISSENTPS